MGNPRVYKYGGSRLNREERGRLLSRCLQHDPVVASRSQAARQQLIRTFFQLRAKNVRKILDTTAQGFFAHPYHSWERGLNENFNGLLRQYFPKGMSLASVTQDEIIAAMCRLNWRPRKCLGFKTPYEAFLEDANTQILGVAL